MYMLQQQQKYSTGNHWPAATRGEILNQWRYLATNITKGKAAMYYKTSQMLV